MDLIKINNTTLVNCLNGDAFSFEAYCDDLTIAVSYCKPTIANLEKANKKSEIMTIIFSALQKKLESFGERGQLSEGELKALVMDYYKLRKSESIEDLLLCLDMGRQGKFGRVYGKIDVVMINEWLVKYFDEKYAYVERLHQSKKHELIIHQDLTQSLKNEIDKKLEGDDDI